MVAVPPEDVAAAASVVEVFCRSLPSVYFLFLVVWLVSSVSWTFHTYYNSHLHTINLQWILSTVPLLKSLQLTLSSFFWYSCFYLERCSLWMSFGVYVTGMLFKTASLVCFLLISQGYCITSNYLPVNRRRSIVALGGLFYLTLVGYRASVPLFSLLLMINYPVFSYTISVGVLQNIVILREQLTISLEDKGIDSINCCSYFFFLSVRGFNRIFYHRWVFRSQDLAPTFAAVRPLKSNADLNIPPIYSIPMSADNTREGTNTILVIIQHPHQHVESGLARSLAEEQWARPRRN